MSGRTVTHSCTGIAAGAVLCLSEPLRGLSCVIVLAVRLSCYAHFELMRKERKEKSTPLGVITGASVPRSSPRLLPLEL